MYRAVSVVFITMLVLFAVLITKFTNLIAIPSLEEFRASSSHGAEHHLTRHVLAEQSEDLMWFMQVTDLHISVFHEPERIEQLKAFCEVNVFTIKPSVVLASGDLTDAKTPDFVGSKQFEEEWKLYKEVLEQCRRKNFTQWLDLRGNHDNFNVGGLRSPQNYYYHYGAKGKHATGSYMHTVRVNSHTKYGFIAVDGSLEPGPKRPFNFIGHLDQAEFARLEKFHWEAHQFKLNGTIWFGHYPTSSLMSPHPGIRQLASSGLAYLCGHFHTLGGVVPSMYTRHGTGLVELELGDWKDNRMYRVGVLDHGLFSFADVSYGTWPIIVVTNPKPALILQPDKEPAFLMKNSSHIRMLLFSPSEITVCQVRINEEPWKPCARVQSGKPLYTSDWDPNKYLRGLHRLSVRAEDSAGRVNEVSIEFSLDGTLPNFSFFGRLALMIDITTIFQVLFGLAMAACLIPLCLARIHYQHVQRKRIAPVRLPVRFLQTWLRKFILLASVNRVFFVWSIYTLYMAVGPWFIGEVIEGKIGAVFAWGIVVDGYFLPGTITYVYGFFQMLTYHLPMTLILAHAVDLRSRLLLSKQQTPVSLTSQLFRLVPLSIVVGVQLILAYSFWLSYGTMAFLIGPMRTWSVPVAIYLWRQANSLKTEEVMWARRILG